MKMDFSGLEELIGDLEQLNRVPDRVKAEMLEAGAAVVVQAHTASIIAHGLVDSGKMQASVAASAPEVSEGNASIDIFPKGKDSTGTRNAEKAFIAEYGSSRQKATHWMENANAQCMNRALQAMEEVYRKWQDSI